MTDNLIPAERIERAILFIRGQKVMLDRDLAELYGVPVKALKQAVRRNAERFPDDVVFELNGQEFENWRSQFVTSNSDRMGLRYAPYAFTEQGVAHKNRRGGDFWYQICGCRKFAQDALS